MRNFSFEDLNNIYASSEGTKIMVHSVSSTNLQVFNRNIRVLFKTISEDGKDDFWSPIISDLKRFRFDLSAAPLLQKIISEKAKVLNVKLINKINHCELVYCSEQAAMLKQLAEQAQQLSDTSETNLLDFLAKLIFEDMSGEIAIAVCNTRLVPLVEETIQLVPELSKCDIVCPNNLKESRCYSSIYIIGAPKWFPEYVFSAPRSKQLHIIKHKWISGNWNPELVLISPFKRFGGNEQQLKIEDDASDFFEDNPEELIPRMDIKKIQDMAMEQLISIVGDEEDIVIAKLFLLENDWAVFLDADDNSSVDIIDLDEDLKRRVRKANIREIQPGAFILLRTEGGGDYIVPVADHIMGGYSEKARAIQKRWKTLLREYVKKVGSPKAIEELLLLGSTRAGTMNLNHWMSLRGIKTAKYDDFLAIMKLIGLENESKNYWETMNIIRRAHTKAGFSIRSMLLDLVNNGNLDPLKHYGKMDFELAVQGAGSLSAFRVIEVTKEETEVIHWRIGEPFRVDNG
jgi:hypothetical protein